MSYVSEEGSTVTAHEHSDLHPVTLAIVMSINVTDKDLTLWMTRGLYSFILAMEYCGLVNFKMVLMN